MRVDIQGDIHSGVTGEVLDLFDVQPLLEPSGHAGVAEQMRMDAKAQSPRKRIAQAKSNFKLRKSKLRLVENLRFAPYTPFARRSI